MTIHESTNYARKFEKLVKRNPDLEERIDRKLRLLMVDIPYPITIKIHREPEASDAPFVAQVVEFDVSSCGKTEEKAVANAKEALAITLDKAKKEGRLTELLEEAGITADKTAAGFPKIIIEYNKRRV